MTHYAMPIVWYCGKTVSRRGSAMIPSDRAVSTSYRLSIVTIFPSASVWSQFSVIGSRTLGFRRKRCGRPHPSDSWDSCIKSPTT